MSLFRRILRRIRAELLLQRLGRRSLLEIQFRKYKVASDENPRLRERLLRKMPRNLGTSGSAC